MIRVKMLNLNETVIIEGTKVFLFNSGGMFFQEVPLLPKYTEGMLDLPIISLLSSGDSCEVALFHQGGDFEKFVTSLDSMECALTLQSNGGFSKMLRRNGKESDIRFNQLMFLYPQGTDLNDKVRNIARKD